MAFMSLFKRVPHPKPSTAAATACHIYVNEPGWQAATLLPHFYVHIPTSEPNPHLTKLAIKAAHFITALLAFLVPLYF